MDTYTLRLKINIVDTTYGGSVSAEVIKKEVEIPFVPVNDIVYVDGAKKYRIRSPEFYSSEWVEGSDPQLRKRVFGCFLNNITSAEKQSYLDDGWVEE